MAKSKRAIVYLDPTLHRALRVKAAESEDAADLAVFEARARETTLPFEDVLKDLKRRGKL